MALPVDLSMDLPPPGYLIYRDSPLGQFDPTAPPVFFPAKDSDELFDALRIKFPHSKTHSERMRDAVIEFLIEERQNEAMSVTASTSPDMTLDNLETSPFEQSWPSMSSSSNSTFSSPELLDLATPNFSGSPQTRPNQSFSAVPSTKAESAAPQIEEMTSVFSLSSSAQPKQRLRRKMTEAEKIEYRKRRIVKACDKCAKRKRKCQHNQPQMETLATTSKVAKARTSPSTKSASSITPRTEDIHTPLDMNAFSQVDSFATDMQLFDDFTTFFDEPLLEFPPLDDKVPFDNFVHSGLASMHQPRVPQNNLIPGLTTSSFNETQEWNSADLYGGTIPSADMHGSDNYESLIAHGHAPQLQNARRQTNATSSRTSSSSSQDGSSQDGQHLYGSEVPGSSLQSPQPTHTRHIHDTESSGSHVLDASGSLSRSQHPRSSPSDSAISSPSTSSASPASIDRLVSPGRTDIQSTGRSDGQSVVHTRPRMPSEGGMASLEEVSPRTGQAIPSGARNGTLHEYHHSPSNSHYLQIQGDQGDLPPSQSDGISHAGDRRSISRDGYGTLRHSSVGERRSQANRERASTSVPVPSRTYVPASQQGVTSDQQVSLAVPGNNGSSSLQDGAFIAQQGRQSAVSQGKQLTGTAHTSTELYLLKKRIALGKPKDGANNGRRNRLEIPSGGLTGLLPILPASSPLGPILQTIPQSQHLRDSEPSGSRASGFQGNGRAYLRLSSDRFAMSSEPSAMSTDSAVIQENRLNDTNRHRDHHGRPSRTILPSLLAAQNGLAKTQVSFTVSAASAPVFAAIGACLLLSAVQNVDWSLLAFAAVMPVAAAKSRDSLVSSADEATDESLEKSMSAMRLIASN